MKKFLLLLLLPAIVFANDYKSRFFACGVIALSKVKVESRYDGGWVHDGSHFLGNGDIHVYGGWEFRPLRWFSLSPAFGFQRNGWSWDRAGHEGSISYFNPYLRLGLGFYIKKMIYIELAGTYGFPTFFWGEQDGKSTTADIPQENAWSSSGIFSIGYMINEHYRVGLTMGNDYVYSTLDGIGTHVYVDPLGVFFTYLF